MKQFNPLTPIFRNTLSKIDVVENMGGSLRVIHPWTKKTVVRKLHRSTIWHNGKKAEYILIDGVRYFAV